MAPTTPRNVAPRPHRRRGPRPVRPGDALRLRATVIETRRSRTQPGLGILRWRWQLFDGEGLEVLDLEATSLFDLQRAAVRSPQSPGLESE